MKNRAQSQSEARKIENDLLREWATPPSFRPSALGTRWTCASSQDRDAPWYGTAQAGCQTCIPSSRLHQCRYSCLSSACQLIFWCFLLFPVRSAPWPGRATCFTDYRLAHYLAEAKDHLFRTALAIKCPHSFWSSSLPGACVQSADLWLLSRSQLLGTMGFQQVSRSLKSSEASPGSTRDHLVST